MSYFTDFPIINYSFGDNETSTQFNNITAYVDIIDQVKDNVQYYENYFIKDWERPDTLSTLLYGTVDYYWTFFLLNDHLKEHGWPMSVQEIQAKAMKNLVYKTMLTTDGDMAIKGLTIGSTITGYVSTATGRVIDILPDLGQVVVEELTGTFKTGGEAIFFTVDNEIVTLSISHVVEQYNSAHHYEDVDGNYIDIDPTQLMNLGSETIPVTYLDMYIYRNEEQKEIKVMTTETIREVADSFRKLVKGS